MLTVFEKRQNGTTSYQISREDLISTIELKEKCDHSSTVLIKNFPEITRFQKYTIAGKCHYRPIVNDGDIQTSGASVSKSVLGSGSFGIVMKYGDSPVAIKVSRDSFEKNIDSLLEYNFLKNLSKSKCCISKAYDFEITNENTVKVYMKEMNMDLYEYITTQEEVPDLFIRSILFDIFRGIYHAHSQGVVHRDLKFENILITKTEAFVADWGLSCYMPYLHYMKKFNPNVVTPSYRAPEIWEKKPYSFSSDVFSLGIVASEMYGKNPHSTWDELVQDYTRRIFIDEVYDDLMNVKLNKENVTHGWELFSWMMDGEPSRRPMIDDVLNSSYFEGLRKDKNNGKTFPAITFESILKNSPDISHVGLKKNVESSRKDLRTIFKNSDNNFELLLATNIYVRYSNLARAQSVDTALNCVKIAKMACEGVIGKDFNSVVLADIAKTLDYNLYGVLPCLYFPDSVLTDEILEKLLQIELTAYKKYDAETIADYVFNGKGSVLFDKTPILKYFKGDDESESDEGDENNNEEDDNQWVPVMRDSPTFDHSLETAFSPIDPSSPTRGIEGQILNQSRGFQVRNELGNGFTTEMYLE